MSFSIGKTCLLHPLTINLPAKGVIGLIGHNGSGKSTLVKILAGQQEPSSGKLRFMNRPLAEWGNREFARELAYLPQQLPSAAGLKVRELVAVGRYPWHGALGRFTGEDRRQVKAAMNLTGVDGLADRLVDTLSGGERQRVWLAMLVAQQAKCLLLDEPIAALDIAHQLDVLHLVRKLAQGGASILVVLHDINMAARFCDEVIALRGGHMIARGSPAEVFQPPLLKRIFGIEMDVIALRETGRLLTYPR
ncbi:ABC transporter ATP-binding protein [Paracoccus onubensis]